MMSCNNLNDKMLFLLFSIVTTFKINAYFGTFDSAYNATIHQKIPWSMFDQIIVSFATLDHANITMHDRMDEQIKNISQLYKNQRPDGQLSMSIYDEHEDAFLYASNHLDVFKTNAKTWLKKYKFNGFDMDWEMGNINDYARDLIKMTSYCTSVAIWPYVHSPKLVGMLKVPIHIMSYTMDKKEIEELIISYNQSGFPFEKMVLGIETESQQETNLTITNKIELVKKYNLSGLFVWRLDNDDIQQGIPTFKTTNMLYHALN